MSDFKLIERSLLLTSVLREDCFTTTFIKFKTCNRRSESPLLKFLKLVFVLSTPYRLREQNISLDHQSIDAFTDFTL